MRGYIPPSTEEERLFCRRVQDALRSVCGRGLSRVMHFCSDREQVLAATVLAKEKHEAFCFFGGYADAERKMLCLAETEDKLLDEESFPLEALLVQCSRSAKSLTHRDYLGALMALRITREYLGDIIIVPQGAVLFAHTRVVPLICDELLEVGSEHVTVSVAENAAALLPQQSEKEPQTASLASLRLDALLSAMLKTSRGTAADLVRSKAVMINHVEITSCHCEVCAGDVFTVRGRGKFKLCEIGGQSKKDRTFVSYIQY